MLLTVFVSEILLKLYAFGGRFFRNPWNVFDFLVVGIAILIINLLVDLSYGLLDPKVRHQ